MPSTLGTNPQVDLPVYSPSPATADAAINSFLFSTASHQIQVIAAIQQDLLSEVKALDQEIFQAFAALEQKWLNLLGISVTASNQAPSNFVMPPVNNVSGSGSGSGSGAATTHHNPDQQLHRFAAQPGSGAGNGVSPDSSGGSATVYGNVWLDNDGDGFLDNGELGFSGIPVALYVVGGTSPLQTTTTDSNGNYSITVSNLGPPPGNNYYIQVGIPNLDYATIPGYSQINANGTSFVFALFAGAPAQKVNAGIRSTNVTTVKDDANNAIIQNQVTLRDAIKTVINGLNNPVTFFTKNQQGQQVPLTGTIPLQAALPALSVNITITGGGAASPIIVQGQGPANPYGIFSVNAGVTAEIDGLTITKGFANTGGGGIYSQGKLTLKGDDIMSNSSNVSGGGLYIKGGTATVEGGSIELNSSTTGSGGGIYVNGGALSLKNGVSISYNKANSANGNGGGMYIYGGKVTMTGGVLAYNSAQINGGGIYNNAGALTLNTDANNNPVNIGPTNVVLVQGGGMYLKAGSTTTFNACIVSNNSAGKGNGIYEQIGAKVGGLGLIDRDDGGGVPVTGA